MAISTSIDFSHYFVEFPGILSLDYTHGFPDLFSFACVAWGWASTSDHVWGNAFDGLSSFITGTLVEHTVDLTAHESFVL